MTINENVTRATADLSERIEVLLTKNRALLTVDDVATLEEVLEYLDQLRYHPPPDPMMLVLRWGEVIARIMGIFELFD